MTEVAAATRVQVTVHDKDVFGGLLVQIELPGHDVWVSSDDGRGAAWVCQGPGVDGAYCEPTPQVVPDGRTATMLTAVTDHLGVTLDAEQAAAVAALFALGGFAAAVSAVSDLAAG